ncbi:hypothetical protein QWY82_11800 [Simiduia curdlanivorans]|uniref:Uncharacterized protein n=1 Tax=Simiduia curdlanivorans TaxID=1492769 RepID=A0ABV8V8E8_9GAMM|nr:hypothetical protein [Simiduia curdlanivorans]MDN3639488.1 hypothetical protein [Simiduia curdlanivorans]
MTCSNTSGAAKHSGLCNVHYPYTRIAPNNDVRATHQRDCTLGKTMVPVQEVDQSLGFEANMDLISLEDFIREMDDNAKLGTYCPAGKLGGRAHFCVDKGRRSVDGRRLAWLWVFPQGQVRPAHKVMSDNPTLIWTKQQIVDAYKSANNKTLPMWTRHVDQHSELAITFCLPFPA